MNLDSCYLRGGEFTFPTRKYGTVGYNFTYDIMDTQGIKFML